MDEKLILDILDFIEKNIYGYIKIDDIAKAFYFNRFYIMRLFRKVTGLTINEYINQRKIVKSIDKVRYSDDKILKIALESGYHSLEYYSEMFYQVTGFSPLQFRRYSKIETIEFIIDSKDLLIGLKKNKEILEKLKSKNVKTGVKKLSLGNF